jgi:hypothetical protein
MPAQQSALATALGFHGDNPKKLPLIDIDPTKVQTDTIAGNLRNSPAAFDLARLANEFSSEELLKMLERMLPGYSSLRDSITGTLASEVRGEIPKDVENQLLRRAAEKGVTLGTSGSQFSSYDTLRNLGLTSLDISQRGLDSASRWLAAMPKAPQFDFTSMFFTPQQRLSFEFSQEQANLPIRQFNNWVDTLPTNLERAGGMFLDWIAQTGSSMLEMGASNVMGGKSFSGAGGGAATASGQTMDQFMEREFQGWMSGHPATSRY